MRSITGRCAAALILLALLLGAFAPTAGAMVYGDIDKYTGDTLNIREDSTAYATIGTKVRLRMVKLENRRFTRLTAKSFKSGKPSVARVTRAGWVKALSPGKTVVTMVAKDGTKYALTLTVLKSDSITRLWFSESKVIARVGKKTDLSKYLKAKPLTALLASKRVYWKSSDTKVALISSTGELTPRKAGAVTVTATCGKRKATIKVKVKE